MFPKTYVKGKKLGGCAKKKPYTKETKLGGSVKNKEQREGVRGAKETPATKTTHFNFLSTSAQHGLDRVR